MIDDKFTQTVINNTNIVDLIGSYISLKRSGSNYKACCPFHEEKTGSFMVSPSKQIYKCFGCGKAGNVITFVRDYEKISYMDALKKLAERINLEIPDNKKNSKKDSKLELIYKIYSLTNEYYVENLKKHGNLAKKYLASRSISEETITKFNIGYALDSFSGLKKYLQRNQINNNILVETGLFKAKDNNVYDMFRDRIMFPIFAINGKVIAYGGRAYTAEQEKIGKYINSPTTPIYIKSKELYGLYHSRFDISKKNYAIIAEGYLDFLRLWECGFTNSVASLGTALTDEQIQLLGRYTKHINILFDGDKAGKNAAIKAAGIAVKHGLNAKIIQLPENEDPDSFLINNPPMALQHLIDNALTLNEFLKMNQNLIETREAIDYLIDISKQMTDPISKDLFLKDISESFKIQESSLREQIAKQSFVQGHDVQKPKKFEFKKSIAEENLIQSILQNNNIIKKVLQEIDFDYFINEDMRIIFKILSDNQDFDYNERTAEFLNKFDNEDLRNKVSGFFLADAFEFDVDDLILQIKVRKYQEDINIINEEITKNPDNAELYERKIFLKREIQALSKSVVHKTLF
ncbi:MAG TPA: DNA primase [Candidatus Cloacimonadota bacterium]|nr:DNA primase [Candidatus Cloacimonadota bacterium]